MRLSMIAPRYVHGRWSSSGAFVLAGAGAAIGLGNIWRLPYLADKYGGGAFLIVYVIALAVMTVPLLIAELVVGRRARTNPVAAIRRLAAESGANRAWIAVGWLALLGAMLVMSFYSVIAGWSLAYLFRAVAGAFSGANAHQVSVLFNRLVSDPERGLAWHTIFTVCAAIVVGCGVRGGIERANRYIVPAMFVLLAILLWTAFATGDVRTGAYHLLRPDFPALGLNGVLEAFTQAFFSVGLGLGIMLAYGAYLPARSSMARLAAAVVLLDLVFAVMAGLAIFPLIFAAGEVPDQSTRLAFEVMPRALGIGGMRWPAVVFYLLLVLVALSSAVALLEPVVSWGVERFRITRPLATSLAAMFSWLLGLCTLLSFNVWAHAELFGKTYYQWLDMSTSRVLLPGVGLLICVFVSRIMRDELVRETWGDAAGGSYRVWHWLLSHPARLGLIIILLHGLGIIDFALRFW